MDRLNIHVSEVGINVTARPDAMQILGMDLDSALWDAWT